MRWLLTLAGGYAGAGTVAFLLYRAKYALNREVRAWSDHGGRELADKLDQLRRDLLVLRRRLAAGAQLE